MFDKTSRRSFLKQSSASLFCAAAFPHSFTSSIAHTMAQLKTDTPAARIDRRSDVDDSSLK